MNGVKLPDGWTCEQYGRSRFYFVLMSPGPTRLAVTLDLDKRGFRGGGSMSGPMASDVLRRGPKPRGIFSGRGWKQALADAAVKWLDAPP